jgi:hypothetical protein
MLASGLAASGSETLSVPKPVDAALGSYCFSCHDEDSEKGDIRLDNLADLSLEDRLDLLNRAQEQLYFEQMPPKDKKEQPTEAERAALVEWVSGELRKHNSSKLEDKLRMPAFGNYVAHDKLFSGEYADLKAFTPDRRWLISEFIFNARFNRLLRFKPFRTIDGERQYVIGDNARNGVTLTNPFLLPTDSGVRYYDTTMLNGGHLLTMITNAREASSYMMFLARNKAQFPAIADIMKLEWEHEKTLATREDYLNKFIDRILADLYKSRNDEHLPEFVRVEVASADHKNEDKTRKAPFHAAQPGKEELRLIFHTMVKYDKDVRSDEELVEKCEREWFNYGHNARQIQMRVTFLNAYLPEWRELIEKQNYAQKNKPPVYAPLADGEMSVIHDTILKGRKKGDTYKEIISKCMADWEEGFRQDRVEAGPPSDEKVDALVRELFSEILEREPSSEEEVEQFDLAGSYLEKLGNRKAVEKLIETLILNSDFVYRAEFGAGEPDEHDRRMLSPRDAAGSIAYALTDSSPDAELLEAAKNGRLETREDYQREVLRLLNQRDQYYIIDESVERIHRTQSFTNLPIRKLRFFREFFGYPNLMPIFKDDKRFGGEYTTATARIVTEADMLVEYILNKDQDVFEELLTTDEFYVFHSGDNEAMAEASRRLRRIYDYFKDKDWQNFKDNDLEKHRDFLTEVGINRIGRDNLGTFKRTIASINMRFDKGQKEAPPFVVHHYHGPTAFDRINSKMRTEQAVRSYNIDLANWDYPTTQPARLPNRRGLLTHPAWLIAHARNTETDPIHRGKWIREKLLAGTIPDVPITVDAVIPEDHTRTLRNRLTDATGQQYCWKCHEGMNPLGNAFEMYDDFGRYRTEEFLEHPDNLVEKRPDKGEPHEDLRDLYKTLPVDSSGHLAGTGDESLDGDVKDAIDLSGRLAESAKVRQSIIRHAFRYFMGRNEVLSDSKTLIDADQAYVESGGSFDAVIVSLLTSDSFIYRKSAKP